MTLRHQAFSTALIERLEPARGLSAQGPSAAVAALLRLSEGHPRVLLMQRAERIGDRWSGQIGLPGGFHEPLDGELYNTACREAKEELSLELERDARLLGALTARAPSRPGVRSVHVQPFVFEELLPVDPRPSPEATASFWLPLEVARSGAIDAEFPLTVDGRLHHFPAWDFEGRIIWGLTYQILKDLLERLAPAGGAEGL